MNLSTVILILLSSISVTVVALAQSSEDADALFNAERWQAAAEAYQQLAAESPDSHAAWFGAAQSFHQMQRFGPAESAYLKALEKGFQPPGRAHYHLARLYMSENRRDQALAQIEVLATLGGMTNTRLQATPEFAPLADHPRFAAIVEKLTPCNTPYYRQFDFWLGEWNVEAINPPSPAPAHSLISIAQGGCAVIEEYKTGGFTGMSLNFYDSVTDLWHQSWMSNGGGGVYLEGGIETGAMVLTDAHLPISGIAKVINRVSWTQLTDGRVRQHWEQSQDLGETWVTVFDGYYTRVEKP